MESLDISAIWLSLVWIALAFAAAWLLNLLAERDSAASRPDRLIPDEREKLRRTKKSHIPGTSA